MQLFSRWVHFVACRAYSRRSSQLGVSLTSCADYGNNAGASVALFLLVYVNLFRLSLHTQTQALLAEGKLVLPATVELRGPTRDEALLLRLKQPSILAITAPDGDPKQSADKDERTQEQREEDKEAAADIEQELADMLNEDGTCRGKLFGRWELLARHTDDVDDVYTHHPPHMHELCS